MPAYESIFTNGLYLARTGKANMHPPQHSVTAPMTVISALAFDIARVNAEQDAMPDGGSSHPWSLYYRGETRYDIDAPLQLGDKVVTVREYLKPDHGFREWKPRRLKAAEVVRCRDNGGKSGQLVAFALAMGDGKPLTDAQVEAMADQYGVSEICEVGEAALRASEAPKAAEKKL